MYMNDNYDILVAERHVGIVTYHFHVVAKLQLLRITNIYRKFIYRLDSLEVN